MTAVHIAGSSLMTREVFRENINFRLKQMNEERLALEEILNARSSRSVLREWACHKLLFNLGLFRSHTHSVDLNYPLLWWEKLGYGILGGLALMIVD